MAAKWNDSENRLIPLYGDKPWESCGRRRIGEVPKRDLSSLIPKEKKKEDTTKYEDKPWEQGPRRRVDEKHYKIPPMTKKEYRQYCRERNRREWKWFIKDVKETAPKFIAISAAVISILYIQIKNWQVLAQVFGNGYVVAEIAAIIALIVWKANE